MNKRKTTLRSDDLDNLSDNELRHRLLQFGFPNMPVTETTRKILVKKLRNHLNEEKMKLKRQTNYITRYSSDEESDMSEPSSVIKGRSAVTNFSPPLTTSNSKKRMPPPATSTVLNRRTNSTANNSNYVSSSNSYSQSSPKTSPKIYVPPPILASESEEDSDYHNYSSKQFYNSSNYSPSSTSATNSYQNSSPTLNNITLDRTINSSWVGGGSPQNTAAGSYFSSNSPRDSNNYATTPQSNGQSMSPYGIDFTRRLLNLRGETIRDSILQKRPAGQTTHNNMPLRQIHHMNTSLDPSDIVYRQSDPVGGSIHIGRYPSTTNETLSHQRKNISPSTAFARLLARLDEHYGFKQTFIPCALVTLFLLFFLLVAIVYITISPDLINTINEKTTIYEICTPHDQNTALIRATYTCIEQEHLQGAIDLLKILVPELKKRAEIHFCSDADQPHAMSAREFIKHVHKLGVASDIRKTLKDLHNAEYLIEKNSQWQIDHVNSDVEKIDFNDVVKLRNTQGNFYAIIRPSLPLTCTLYNKLQDFFVFIGTVTLAMAIIALTHFFYKFLQNRRQTKIATVECLTNEIIAELMRQAISDTGPIPYVVNHLRDKIIPLHKRKEKTWAWNEAIRNLELNDSRVQFNMTIRNGEECKTMKWIANVSMDTFGRSTVKQWQSPAFDKTNKIVQPPTSCLKIRQMFEPAEANNPHLKQIIQDAILEKVGPNCKIYDIQLDKQTCCVYVQCATEQDAGIVHNEINGWWFDKRLVSIKFLRLQRYKCRFPNSGSTKCLQPSNSNNLSMTQCTRNLANASGLNMDADDDDDDDDEELDEEEQ